MGPCQDNTPNEYRTRNIQYSQLCTQASETPPRARQQRVTKEGLLVSYFSTRKKVTRRFLFPIAQHHLFFCTIWIFVSRTTQSVSTTVDIEDSRLRVINPSLVLTALVMFWKEWEHFFTSRERFEIGSFTNPDKWWIVVQQHNGPFYRHPIIIIKISKSNLKFYEDVLLLYIY